MKYVFVVGGVISGVGKGVFTASLARVLKSRGLKVKVIKVDPYYNVDAGTMRPTEHGEVWVTWDGGETDQDLGTYERFLNQNTSYSDNITSGKVFLSMIEKERRGEFLGKTVDYHELLEEIYRAWEREEGDVTVVEIGGTIGDYNQLPFLHAAALTAHLHGRENVKFVLLVYLPKPGNLGEPKTKPAQMAVTMLRQAGIVPNLVVVRSEEEADSVRLGKIARTTYGIRHAISLPNVSPVYRVPLVLEEKKVAEYLGFPGEGNWEDWERRLSRIEDPDDSVEIAIVGKYVKSGNFTFPDAYVSIVESLIHAWAETGIKPEIKFVPAQEIGSLEAHGIIVPGGFGSTGVEGKIEAIQMARENEIPFLGLCYGMQLAVVEFSRNVLGLDAHTTEVDPDTPHPVIDFLPGQKEVLEVRGYGRSMRLGEYLANIREGTLAHRVYKGSEREREARELVNKVEEFRRGEVVEKLFIFERHRHRYEVNPRYVPKIQDGGGVFSGYHRGGIDLMEIFELPDHPFFVGTQFHPEFKSRFESPAPLFVEFLKASAH